MVRRIKRKSGVCRGCGHTRALDAVGAYCTPCHREGRATTTKVVKRIYELMTPKPPKNKAQKDADEVAAEKMRSQKGSDWRLGKSPGSYG